ncbi:MAG: helix-turn-helix domain-containing protein [Oligoflexus sp.]
MRITKEKRQKAREDLYRTLNDEGSIGLIEGIVKIRHMLGMNQKEFAQYVELSPRIIIEFESGKGNPTVKTIEKIFSRFGIELALRKKDNY